MWDPRNPGRPLRKVSINSRSERRDVAESGHYLGCTNGHEIPNDYFSVPSVTIGLLGPTMSMKSHFIAAVAHRLVEDGGLDLDDRTVITGIPATRTDATLYDEYFGLLDAHVPVERTEPVIAGKSPIRSPLSLQMRVVSDRMMGVRRDGNLMLFDAPGEKLVNRAGQREVAPYLMSCSALVVFVDPLQIPSLRELISTTYDPEFREMRYRAKIVNSAAVAIRDFEGLRFGELIDLPLFITISKADLLLDARGDSALREIRSVSRDEQSAIARDCLETHLRGLCTQAEHNFRSVSYSFTSATGCAPANGKFPYVEPWGCDELLLDVLRGVRWPR